MAVERTCMCRYNGWHLRDVTRWQATIKSLLLPRHKTFRLCLGHVGQTLIVYYRIMWNRKRNVIDVCFFFITLFISANASLYKENGDEDSVFFLLIFYYIDASLRIPWNPLSQIHKVIVWLFAPENLFMCKHSLMQTWKAAAQVATGLH